MQAIKEKLSDMNALRKAKSEARAEEQAEKDLAKARMEVAREVRLAKEAEAAMDLHVNKAAEKAVQHAESKHSNNDDHLTTATDHSSSGPASHDPSTGGAAYTGNAAQDSYGRDAASNTTTGYTLDRSTGGHMD